MYKDNEKKMRRSRQFINIELALAFSIDLETMY